MINGELIVDELPGGSSGRGCGRAAEVRVGLEKAVSV